MAMMAMDCDLKKLGLCFHVSLFYLGKIVKTWLWFVLPLKKSPDIFGAFEGT